MATNLSSGYLITARQFSADGYAERIGRGECRVFYWHEAPKGENDTPQNRMAYEYVVRHFGNVDQIASVEMYDDENYAILNAANGLMHLGVGADQELLVLPVSTQLASS